ncbi:MAG: GGDEF domain-containing protein [Clostridia bacterium]|nr:GGDEF domain-containing protein [Clostridia bacterium]
MITKGHKALGVFMNRSYTSFQETVQRISRQRAKELGYDVFYFITVGYRDSENYYDALEKSMFTFAPIEDLDGALVTPGDYDMPGFREALFAMLERKPDFPVVCIRDSQSCYDSFFTDEANAIRPLITHMLDDHGYRKVCFEAGYRDHVDSDIRLKCYLEEMEKRGIALPENAIYYGNMWSTNADKAYDYFFADPDNIPEAIICANDHMALALMDEIIAHGYRVPQDVAVVGFDNIDTAEESTPALTTVGQDYEKMVRMAVDRLHQRIVAREQGEKLPYSHQALPGSLKLRESCGCEMPGLIERRLENAMRMNSVLRSISQREVSQTYFAIEMNASEDYESIHRTIFRKLGDIPAMRDFYLCLFEDANGELAERITDHVRLISAIQDRKDLGTPGTVFPRRQILPDVAERPDEPQAFYIHLLHQRDSTYGYTAMQLKDNELPSMFYMHWNIIVSIALRTLSSQFKLEALYEERRRSSITDMLTGINNRRGFDELLSPRWEEMCRQGRTVCFMSLDLDNLKPLNDTFGHQGGDEALIAIARAIEAAMPQGGIAARIGGDEFLVFVPECDEGGVASFRTAFEKHLKKRNEGATFVVGASIGARVITLQQDTSMDECVRESDEAMYQEKKRRHAELRLHAQNLK